MEKFRGTAKERQDRYLKKALAGKENLASVKKRKNFKKLLQNPLTNSKKSCIIYTVVETAGCSEQPVVKETARESGGTGRRARLRGVWFTPYGFKSRFSHQTCIGIRCNIRGHGGIGRRARFRF